MKRILLTGAGGNLGRVLRETLKGWVDILRLSDISDLGEAEKGEELQHCDLSNFDEVMTLVSSCDGIIHLGGQSTESTFDTILNANIVGTYNIYEAARRQGISRILFASSNHTIGFYERETRLDASVPMRPDSLYGVSKGYGELLARYYYDKFAIETANVRIGSCFDKPKDRRMLATWMSHSDFTAMVKRVFEVDRLGCPIIYGVSANKELWWDNHMVSYLGWQPNDNSEIFASEPHLQKQEVDSDSRAIRFQGGGFAAAGHFEDGSR